MYIGDIVRQSMRERASGIELKEKSFSFSLCFCAGNVTTYIKLAQFRLLSSFIVCVPSSQRRLFLFNSFFLSFVFHPFSLDLVQQTNIYLTIL